MLLKEVLRGIEYKGNEIPSIDIKNVTANLNLINENTLFVFIEGINFDTKRILKDIVSKKPGIIISETPLYETEDIPIIYVNNIRKAYSYSLYNLNGIDKNRLKFYAVTGTNGKTTTATMLYDIFSAADIKCGFIGTGKILIGKESVSDSFYSMTTPDPELLYPTIKRMESEGCEKIVMEVSSHALSLFKVAPLEFECSIFTNLSEEHIDFHKDIEEYYHAKLSLFMQSKCGIFNLDDEYSKRAFHYLSPTMNTHCISVKSDADAVAKDIIFNGLESTEYIYRESRRIFKIRLNTVGEYNVSNSLLAIKCALNSGVDTEAIKIGLGRKKSIEGRFEIVSRSPMVIIDYAHTHSALKNVFKFVKTAKNAEQNIITVFGCGGERDTLKRPKMAAISEEFSDFSVVTSDNSRSENTSKIIADIVKGFTTKEKYTVIENRANAIKYALSKAARANDIVLIIGKGHERYNIDAEGYHRFDEREIIFEALKERKARENENKNRTSVNTFYDSKDTGNSI